MAAICCDCGAGAAITEDSEVERERMAHSAEEKVFMLMDDRRSTVIAGSSFRIKGCA